MTLRDARVVVRLALPIKRRGNPLRIFTHNSIKGTPPRLTRHRAGFVYKNGQKLVSPTRLMSLLRCALSAVADLRACTQSGLRVRNEPIT